jgi:NhaP-type Na+/H+ and K+/H+ antiporter
VFVAVLCFEWISTESGPTALGNFGLRLVIGLLFGLIGGIAIYYAERKRFVPENMVNVFALASAVLLFGITESVLTEAGLLSVTIAGFVLGVKKPVRLEQIRKFKAEITDLLIGTLFILLAARLSPEQFIAFGYQGVVVVAIVMFVVRPINVLICTWNQGLNWREKMFLSWVAPRGIVAASMASLFALSGKIAAPGNDVRFIETFVYSIIVATILFQGFSAGYLARLLGLYDPRRTGWMIVGAHPFAREIAQFIRKSTNAGVFLVDTNATAVDDAEREGIAAVLGDARNAALEEIHEQVEVQSVGNLLALTDNESLNTLVCQNWGSQFGSEKVYRWGTLSSTSPDNNSSSGNLVWSDLPKPSLISDAFRQEAISLMSAAGYEDDGNEIKTPVLSANSDGEIVLDPPSLDSHEQLETTLYLKQEAGVFASEA